MSVNLYTLAEDRLLSEQASYGPTTYNCQLVLGGPDAAIEISKEKGIRLFLDGKLTANTAFVDFVSNYHEALRTFADEVCAQQAATVIIGGKWHHVEFHHEPFFAPYVVHKIDSRGVLSTKPYDCLLFHTDDLEEGRRTFITIDATSDEQIVTKLRTATEGSLHLWTQGPPPSTSRHARFAGALYRPQDVTKSAVYTQFSGLLATKERAEICDHLFAREFSELRTALLDAKTRGCVTDDLRSAYSSLIRATSAADGDLKTKVTRHMFEEFSKSDFGLLNDVVVRRTSVLSNKSLSLRDLANATTAPGYWMQTRFEGNSDRYDPKFTLFDESHWYGKLGDELLDQVAGDAAHENNLGCRYASRWIDYGASLEVRFLAIGPVPTLSWHTDQTP